MISRDNLMWLAGYLEGEGCFTISINYTKSKGKSYRILVTSEDLDVIEKTSRLLVGYSRITSSRHQYNKKIFYGTNVNGSRAISWMMTLYSLMGTRRKKRIKEVINDWRNNIRQYSMSDRAVKTRRDRKIKSYRPVQVVPNEKPMINPFDKKEQAKPVTVAEWDVTKALTND